MHRFQYSVERRVLGTEKDRKTAATEVRRRLNQNAKRLRGKDKTPNMAISSPHSTSRTNSDMSVDSDASSTTTRPRVPTVTHPTPSVPSAQFSQPQPSLVNPTQSSAAAQMYAHYMNYSNYLYQQQQPPPP